MRFDRKTISTRRGEYRTGSSPPGWQWHYNGALQGKYQEVGISLRVSCTSARTRLRGNVDVSGYGRIA